MARNVKQDGMSSTRAAETQTDVSLTHFHARFMIANVFLGIIDKNFREEDKLRAEAEADEAYQGRGLKSLFKPPDFVAAMRKALGPDRSASLAHTASSVSAADTAEKPFRASSHEEASTGGTPKAGRSSIMAASGSTGSARRTSGGPTRGNSSSQMVSMPSMNSAGADGTGLLWSEEDMKSWAPLSNWHHLPEEMRTWSLRVSTNMKKFLQELHETKTRLMREDGHDIEYVMSQAEQKMDKSRKHMRTQADKLRAQMDTLELLSLRNVHEDQDTLAWYIMKRESELKTLEELSERKHEQIERLLQRAKGLIEEPEGVLTGPRPLPGFSLEEMSGGDEAHGSIFLPAAGSGERGALETLQEEVVER
eukprot:TRINITY_DN26661_c1_g1_i2.p1 TRINITY_DN26661_c1_g1~~TRINITY_DN26661_c1_g1_i2.p1  ORF type:complete len:365 (-),score=96.94 TRINITY_DN26661_c1_g1_i2:55-1149(-)